ncbi:MAG: tetratricopeptide repeat protein [Pseudomonadota bacterium]
MKCPRILLTVIAVTFTIGTLWHARAVADVAEHYQPPVLQKAERALLRGDPGKAMAMLEESEDSLRRVRERASAQGLICRAFYMQGDVDRAEVACDSAVRLGGNAPNSSHLNNRGIMRLAQGRLDEALDDFQRAALIDPRDRDIRTNLVLVKQAQEELRTAVAGQ